jgi:hypothetical protein
VTPGRQRTGLDGAGWRCAGGRRKPACGDALSACVGRKTETPRIRRIRPRNSTVQDSFTLPDGGSDGKAGVIKVLSPRSATTSLLGSLICGRTGQHGIPCNGSRVELKHRW